MSSSELQPGDMIAVSGQDYVSRAIQLGTVSLPNVPGLRRWAGISHVGIVVPVFWGRDVDTANGALLVYESTSTPRPPCVRLGDQTNGVQAHRLSTILSAGGDVYHYPLKRELYEHEIWRLTESAEACLRKTYDFVGAARAWGGIVTWAISQLVERDRLTRLFCSEFVAHVWGQVGIMRGPVAGAWSPNRLCRYAVRHGICQRPKRLT